MTSEDSFSGIGIFLVTARSATFTEAAERLGITKSAVGKAIARLEGRLGTSLFYRSTRRLSLSADGEAYLAVWSSALEEIKATETGFGNRFGEPAGRLRVDMPVAFGKQMILPVLLEMASKYSALQLTLSFSDRINDITEEGIDVAIRLGSVDDVPGLVARTLATQRWVICATPDYIARHGAPEVIEDLKDHRAIVGYRGGSTLAWKFSVDGSAVKYAPPPTFQFDDADAMISATKQGLGLCQMPKCLFQLAINSGELVTVLQEFEPSPIEVNALWSKTNHLRPKIRHFIDSLIILFKEKAL
ncbi:MULTISPECIES: LysR family transcriptional regulator [Pseudomonas]|uniref:LysR family transcriptional regulator n=1 Tax=Pseudomonas TaxID=286 RepID=UPI0005C56422|nr:MULTISPECIES: LysR family transcriptional regulator [Pseudomonas]WOB57048.1 LysR family transcriptional regulator [Pseudomonas sp. NBB]